MFPSFDKAPYMQIKNSSQRHSSINSINFKVVLVSSYFWKIYKLVAKEKKNKILNFRRKRFPTATVERIKKKKEKEEKKKERKKSKIQYTRRGIFPDAPVWKLKSGGNTESLRCPFRLEPILNGIGLSSRAKSHTWRRRTLKTSVDRCHVPMPPLRQIFSRFCLPTVNTLFSFNDYQEDCLSL